MKKTPRWVVTVVLVLALTPVLYVASFGPACWLVWTAWARDWPVDEHLCRRCLSRMYDPLFSLMQHGPEPIADALVWYSTLVEP